MELEQFKKTISNKKVIKMIFICTRDDDAFCSAETPGLYCIGSENCPKLEIKYDI